MTSAIEFRGVSRVFGDVRAVDDVSFAIEPGEFFAVEGSTGYIELALNQGSAAERLNVERGAEIEVESRI